MAHFSRKGVKRKREEEDDMCRTLQRQSIIDMSMGKLQVCSVSPRRHEPCLRRCVLILNTLKHMETELKQEGCHSHQSSEAAMDQIPEMSTTQLTLDRLPDMSTFMYPLNASAPLPMSVDSACSQATSNHLTPHSSVIHLLPAKPVLDPDFRERPVVSDYYSLVSQTSTVPISSWPDFNGPPSASLTGDFDPSAVNSASSVAKTSQGGDSNNNVPVQGHFPSSATSLPQTFSAFSLDGVDLSELDSLLHTSGLLSESMAACSVSTPPLASSQAACSLSSSLQTMTASSSLASASKSLEEILHSLQQASECALCPLAACSSPCSSSALNSQCSASCRCHSLLDDLDSIMQILVGI